jgi:hypothetical protein
LDSIPRAASERCPGDGAQLLRCAETGCLKRLHDALRTVEQQIVGRCNLGAWAPLDSLQGQTDQEGVSAGAQQ